jgi:tRNA-guanine family transglycosylase
MAQFALHAQDGLARLGKLVTKHGTISTPGSLIYTRRGNSLFLTPDMLQRLKPQAEAVQITAIQFLENPNPETMAKSGGGAREFLALQGFPIIATNRDPTYYEYGTRPSNANAVYTMLPSGGMLVTPDRYMSTIKALQPDAYVAMCDEIYGDAKPKRIQQSVERTSKWLQQCVALHKEQQQPAMLFAPITGEAQPVCHCGLCNGSKSVCLAFAWRSSGTVRALPVIRVYCFNRES